MISNCIEENTWFLLDLEKEAPGPLLMNTEQIIKEIKKLSPQHNEKLSQEFSDRFCYLEDGQAAKKSVDAIFEV